MLPNTCIAIDYTNTNSNIDSNQNSTPNLFEVGLPLLILVQVCCLEVGFFRYGAPLEHPLRDSYVFPCSLVHPAVHSAAPATLTCHATHTHTHTHTHTQSHTYMHTHTHMCTHTHMHTHTRTYTHMHTHTPFTLPSKENQCTSNKASVITRSGC